MKIVDPIGSCMLLQLKFEFFLEGGGFGVFKHYCIIGLGSLDRIILL